MDNYQTVVGNKDCPLKTLVSLIRQSTVIRDEWSTFARQLDVSSDQVKRFRQNLLLNIITQEDLLVEVFEIWIGKNGSKATLASLLQVVEEHCGANDIGELLRLEYNLPCREAEGNPSIEWKDLSPAFQKRVIQTFQHFTPNFKHTEILPKLTGTALVRLMRGKKLHILSLPEELSYYVSRTIVTRNIISDKIFDESSSDIFLFTGVDRYELSVLAKNKLTGNSRRQLHHPSNIKFMILEQANHFDRICGNTDHSVHLITKDKEENGKFRWMKSKGGMHNLRKYIDQQQDELEEGQFCKICDSQSLPMLICDSPGMGKSVLLAQIGHRLAQLYPDRTVLFIELSEFIKHAKSLGIEDKLQMIQLTLQNWSGEPLPESKMNCNEENVSIELLLDGYDEVDSDERTLGLEIFQTITKSFACIRLWITSRPHLMDELENSLNVLGYNIRPFHEENQINFLSSVWSRKVQLDQEKVEMFAKNCLKSLKATMNSTDNDIAGIPLQCLLIGEVYEDDAVEYAKLGKENVSSATLEIEVGTITNLYRQLVKKKFEKYKSSFGHAKLMTIHSHLSLELLFPLEHATLRLTKVGEIDIDDVMKGGILSSTRVGAVTFLHRTFAEYFVAWFIFDKLENEERWKPELLDLFFKILGVSRSQNLAKFVHPVICYFLNSMMTNLQVHLLPTGFLTELNSSQLAMIEMIALACLEGNFVQIFKLFDEHRTFDKLPCNFFNDGLLLLSIRNSSVELVKSVLAHFERHHNFDLEVQKATLCKAVKNGKFSILEFLIKEKQLGGVVEGWDEKTNLVCDCIQKTMYSSKEEINDKILVLQMLVGIKRSLVDSLNGSSVTTPLLSRQAHMKLRIVLVQLGANVLVQNERGKTILHLSNVNFYNELKRARPDFAHEVCEDYHKLVMSIPMNHLKKLVHLKSKLPNPNDTPLMTILRSFDPVPETLDIFHQVGADFNHVNENGDSILTVAIENGRNGETIGKLVRFGNKVKRSFLSFLRPFRSTNLLHVAAEYGNVDAVKVFLEELKINVNFKDENGLTPLDHAIDNIIFSSYAHGGDKRFEVCLALFERGGRFKKVVNSSGGSLLHTAATKNLESVRLLIQLGLDVNGIDKKGNTPLHLVAQCDRRSSHIPDHLYSTIQYLLEKGANPCALNNRKETPFHAFLRNKDKDLKIFRLFRSAWDERSLWTQAMATVVLEYAIGLQIEDAILDKDFDELSRECETHGGILSTPINH